MANELIFFGYRFFSDKDKTYGGESFPFINKKKREEIFESHLLNANGIGPFSWAYFYKKSFLKHYNIKFPEGYQFEDIPFTSKAIFYAKKMEVYDEKVLYHYRIHDKSFIQSTSKQKIKDRFEAYSELQEFLVHQNVMEKYKPLFVIRLLVFCIYQSYEDYKRLSPSESDQELDCYMEELCYNDNLLSQENLDVLYELSANDFDDNSPYKKAYFTLKEWKKSRRLIR